MPAPTALLIVRAWSEPGADPPRRFSVRWTPDVSVGLTHERSFADAATASALVHDWLTGLERNGGTP